MTSALLDHLEVALGGGPQVPSWGAFRGIRSFTHLLQVTREVLHGNTTAAQAVLPSPRPRNAPAQQYKYHISSSFTV